MSDGKKNPSKVETVMDIWRFPEIGLPLVIIGFNGIFHYKPSSYWGSPMTMETSISHPNPLNTKYPAEIHGLWYGMYSLAHTGGHLMLHWL